MKLSLFASAAIACAVGVTPAAFAENTSAPQPVLALSNGAQPTTAVDVRYPYRELRDRSEGACTVVFDVNAAGEPTNLRTQTCSSRDFAREAERVAASLRYPSNAMPADGLRDQSFTLRWEGEG